MLRATSICGTLKRMFRNDESTESLRRLEEGDCVLKKKKKGFSTAKSIPASFFMVIAIGTILLSLPISTVSGESDLLTALFTATTSVCVTGLVVVDTFSYWSLFGKFVILCLIQIGGLGLIAIISSAFIFTGQRVSLKNRIRIHDSFGLDNMEGLIPFLRKVIIGTLLVELVGAILYLPVFIPRYGVKGIWFAIFNAVSAFCNAGIDILGPDSLMSYSTSPLVLINSMMLIILGGLGYVVWWNVLEVFKLVRTGKIALRDFWRNLSIHSRAVLLATFLLITSAALIIFVMEYANPDTIGPMSVGNKILNSFFESVTLRTAGFASFSQGAMHEATITACIGYMLIGGSPVGTAGGIKTVSAVVLFCTVQSVIRGKNETTIFHRKIEDTLIKRALSVTAISVVFFVLFTVLLMISNHVNLVDAMFEVASAIATVGLSRGITGSLNTFGKVLIIIAMYLGRIGPISMFIAFSNRYAEGNSLHHAKADLIVG